MMNPRKLLNKLMNSPRVLGFLRHVLTTAGGVLVTGGMMNGATLDLGVGFVLALTGFWASAKAPEKQKVTDEQAAAAPRAKKVK